MIPWSECGPGAECGPVSSVIPAHAGIQYGMNDMNPADFLSHQLPFHAGSFDDGARGLPTHGGVVAFVDGQGRLIQLLATQNIRRTVMSKSKAPAETSRRVDLASVTRTLRWRPGWSRFETTVLYWQIARKIWPDQYRDTLGFGPVWFAQVEPNDAHPRWTCDWRWSRVSDVAIGPFTTRRSCQGFVELLEELFDLCRYHHVLVQTPHGQACTYYDIGRCPAPCNGSISMDQYRSMVDASVRFARGETSPRLAELQDRMAGLSRSREYERAAGIRGTLDRAKETLQNHLPLARTALDFRYLVLTRGPRRTQVKPFFVANGTVDPGEAVESSLVPEMAPGWLARVSGDAVPFASDPVQRSESIALVCHFLRKRQTSKQRFLYVDDDCTPDKVVRCVQDSCGRRSGVNRSDNDIVSPTPNSVDPAG